VPEIREAKQIFEKAKSDPKARELIEAREKALRDYANDIANAKDEGKAEGKAEMALAMLRAGVGADFIAQTSGLSIKEIESLRDEQ
jgi:predicted transposase/invertase (TIGR01784 family)